MAVTPETAPQSPRLPLKPIQKAGLITAAIATAAGAGLAWQMFRGAGREPQTVPQTPNTPSEPQKAPEDGRPVVIFNAPTHPEPSPTAMAPQPTPTPEKSKIEAFDCAILSPEACATGEYIQWTVSNGTQVRGMGFILNPQETIKIPENLQVVSTKYKQPSTYNGYLIEGYRKDGTSLSFFTTANPDSSTLEVGQNLPARATVGMMGEGKETVFNNSPYNFIVYYGSDDTLNKFFPNHRSNPDLINNTPPSQAAKNIAPPIFNHP